jgi:hypothetical protein
MEIWSSNEGYFWELVGMRLAKDVRYKWYLKGTLVASSRLAVSGLLQRQALLALCVAGDA